MKYQSIMITGGLGFIGSNFANYCSQKYPETTCVIYDIVDYCASLDNVKWSPNLIFVKGDICDRPKIEETLEKYRIDIVFHLAAKSHVDDSFLMPLDYTHTNCYGTHILLECSRIYGKLKLFVHMSTDEVYGNNCTEKFSTEKCCLDPTTPYSASKAAGEMIVKAYHHTFRFPIIILRCNNVYGINQYPEKLIPKFIISLLRGGKLTIHGNGKYCRNFIHVNDLCKVLDFVADSGKLGEIYNISSNLEMSVLEFSEILCNLFEKDRNTQLVFVEDRIFNDLQYHINCDKIKDLGWKFQDRNFREDLLEIIQWYRENLHRYADI